MKKRIVLIFFLILFCLLPFVNAVKLGVSNSTIKFNMSVNDEECKKIIIGTDYIGKITAELKFGENYYVDNSPDNYYLDSEYFKLKSNYEKEIEFERPGNKETALCLSGKNPGKYKGLLIFKTKEGYAAIGIWIFVNLFEDKLKNIKLGLCCTPALFLSALLIVLVIYNKKNNHKEG